MNDEQDRKKPAAHVSNRALTEQTDCGRKRKER